jgi:hypothetical protein
MLPDAGGCFNRTIDEILKVESTKLIHRKEVRQQYHDKEEIINK